METTNSISLEVMGMKAAANGQFAILCLIVAGMFCSAGFLVGRKRGWW